MSLYSLQLPNQTILNIEVSDDVFKPTHTSDMCIKAAYEVIKTPGKILDLGCGSGAVGIAVEQMLQKGSVVYASDVSKAAVDLAIKNAKNHNISIDCRVGSCFEPWKGTKFDYIIDDVSGIAEPAAKISPWFGENIPCASGKDGTNLTIEVLELAGNYLNSGGTLIFPVISLSNHQKIIDAAEENYSNLSLIDQKNWMLPEEMKPKISELTELKQQGLIDFDEKFGMILCWTKIYQCNP